MRRVTPWLLDDGNPPERERVVPHESMVDITQTISCIQCGACVSACLSMEADPDFIGPAALAKAYRFVGDPRDVADATSGSTTSRRTRTASTTAPTASAASTPAPRASTRWTRSCACGARPDEADIDDKNNGHSHEAAFTKIIEKKGTLDESLLLQESLAPGRHGQDEARQGVKGLLESLPTAIRGIRTGKMRSLSKLIPGVHPKLPGDVPGPRRKDLRACRGEQVAAQPLHHRDRRGQRRRARVRHRPDERKRFRKAGGPPMKLAYWPGCVSRGFTTELHGSMALVAEGLGIELRHARPRELLRRGCDRRAQPGARRHPERADIRARPGDRPGDDEHLLDLPGRAVRVPGAARRERRVPQAHQRGALRRGARVRRRQGRLHEQELPLAPGRGHRPRHPPLEGQAAARGPARRPVLRLLRPAPEDPPRLRRAPRSRHLPRAGDRGRSAARSSTTTAHASAAASRSSR